MPKTQEEIPVEKSSDRSSDWKSVAGQKYDAAQIEQIGRLEAVRKRPGMFIGDPDERGLHHLVFEVLDIRIDEHLAGFCTKIEVTVHVDGSLSVRDNGRGIPVDIHPKWKMPAIELVLTNLHAGGKFGQGAYKYSGGLHGVGAKCTNALSEWFKAEVSRDGKVYHMAFAKAKRRTNSLSSAKSKTKRLREHSSRSFPIRQSSQSRPSLSSSVSQRGCANWRFLNPGLEITLTDERGRPGQDRKVFLQTRHRGIRKAARREQTGAASEAHRDLSTAR